MRPATASVAVAVITFAGCRTSKQIEVTDREGGIATYWSPRPTATALYRDQSALSDALMKAIGAIDESVAKACIGKPTLVNIVNFPGSFAGDASGGYNDLDRATFARSLVERQLTALGCKVKPLGLGSTAEADVVQVTILAWGWEAEGTTATTQRFFTPPAGGEFRDDRFGTQIASLGRVRARARLQVDVYVQDAYATKIVGGASEWMVLAGPDATAWPSEKLPAVNDPPAKRSVEQVGGDGSR